MSLITVFADFTLSGIVFQRVGAATEKRPRSNISSGNKIS